MTLRVLLLTLCLAPASAAQSLVGTAVVTSTANSSSVDITVPATTTFTIMCTRLYTAGLVDMGSITLEAVAMTQLFSLSGTGFTSMIACFIGLNPPIGATTTFAWDLSGTDPVINGSGYVFRFFASTAEPIVVADVVVDSDYASDETGSTVTIGPTVTSTSAGNVWGWVPSYVPSSAPDGNPGGSGQTIDENNVAGWTDYQSDLVHETTPGASTTTITGTVAFGNVAVVSTKDFTGRRPRGLLMLVN